MLVRRSAFEAIGGFDEGLFLYCEDTDICLRLLAGRSHHALRAARATVATSAVPPRVPAGRRRCAAASRVLLRAQALRAAGARGSSALGVALDEATHALAAATRPAKRRGHIRALRAAVKSG